jgi:hypothetical protein
MKKNKERTKAFNTVLREKIRVKICNQDIRPTCKQNDYRKFSQFKITVVSTYVVH